MPITLLCLFVGCVVPCLKVDGFGEHSQWKIGSVCLVAETPRNADKSPRFRHPISGKDPWCSVSPQRAPANGLYTTGTHSNIIQYLPQTSNTIQYHPIPSPQRKTMANALSYFLVSLLLIIWFYGVLLV